MKILIAVDGSACSTKATKQVVLHFDWYRDRPDVHLVNVQVPVGAYRTRGLLSDDDVANFYQVEAKAALAPSEKLLRRRAIEYKSTYMIGHVAQELHAYAKKHKIDMMVLGSHGTSAFENLVMGSVATKVMATASIPVMLIR